MYYLYNPSNSSIYAGNLILADESKYRFVSSLIEDITNPILVFPYDEDIGDLICQFESAEDLQANHPELFV